MALRIQSLRGPEGYRFANEDVTGAVSVILRRWSVEVGGRRRSVELEHRTWWQRAILKVDGSIVIDRTINLAIGYDHAARVSSVVDDHRLDVTIRMDGVLRPTYRYALSVDGAPVEGSDDVPPPPTYSARPTLVGVVESIIWASILVAVTRTLAEFPIRALALIPGAIVASWLLRRPDMPPSWRVVAAVLLVVTWIVGVAVLAGAYDPPRGI